MNPATDAERIEAERAEAEKRAIRHLYRLWTELVRAEALPELLQMIAPDAVFLPDDAPQLKGRERFASAYRQAFDGFRLEQTFREEELTVAGNFAVARGTLCIEASPKDGGPPQRLVGHRALMVLQRGQDGRWRFARGMTNSFRPASDGCSEDSSSPPGPRSAERGSRN